jgi:hypothetical protein
MGRNKNDFHGAIDPSKGAPGNYTLNQKVQKFGDRRTKRERDKSSQNRKAIDRSRNYE